jgi:hypothetical protein
MLGKIQIFVFHSDQGTFECGAAHFDPRGMVNGIHELARVPAKIRTVSEDRNLTLGLKRPLPPAATVHPRWRLDCSNHTSSTFA